MSWNNINIRITNSIKGFCISLEDLTCPVAYKRPRAGALSTPTLIISLLMMLPSIYKISYNYVTTLEGNINEFSEYFCIPKNDFLVSKLFKQKGSPKTSKMIIFKLFNAKDIWVHRLVPGRFQLRYLHESLPIFQRSLVLVLDCLLRRRKFITISLSSSIIFSKVSRRA